FTVDDKLYQRVEILNTQTQPSEAIGIQGFQMFPGSISRMSFERKFSILTSCGSFQEPFDQVGQVFRREKCWCAPSQVNIPDNEVLTQLRFIERPFLQNIPDIRFLHLMVLGNPRIAAAIGAQAFTKRKVNIQTNAFARRPVVCDLYGLNPLILRPVLLVPMRHGRVTGVTRSRYVIFLY